MSQLEIMGIDYASGEDWTTSAFEIDKHLSSALGISEEFLRGTPSSTVRENILNMRAELTDPVRIAERDARTKVFMDYLADLQYGMFLKMAFFIVTRRGVTVSVVVPKAEIKQFRSLRTANVWNKRRMKENAKRV